MLESRGVAWFGASLAGIVGPNGRSISQSHPATEVHDGVFPAGSAQFVDTCRPLGTLRCSKGSLPLQEPNQSRASVDFVKHNSKSLAVKRMPNGWGSRAGGCRWILPMAAFSFGKRARVSKCGLVFCFQVVTSLFFLRRCQQKSKSANVFK